MDLVISMAFIEQMSIKGRTLNVRASLHLEGVRRHRSIPVF